MFGLNNILTMKIKASWKTSVISTGGEPSVWLGGRNRPDWVLGTGQVLTPRPVPNMSGPRDVGARPPTW